MAEKKVYVVHCVDTEGPLYESLSATFERLYSVFKISLDPTLDNLKSLQNKQIGVGGCEEDVALMLNNHLLSYHDDWGKIDTMLQTLLSEEYRCRFLDSQGSGWIYNWFCLDHVGYEVNPRRRDMGYHNIYDHYRNILDYTRSSRDGVHFHYHPMPFSLSAHHCATHYFAHSDTLFQILARRIIDRKWFPCANRPGFHVIRPDSHWFLEQYIPFDFSSQACTEQTTQSDLCNGRLGDWRNAPITWEPYHPDHDDYQRKGTCRRLIMRCLNMATRVRNISQADVNQAFAEAAEGKPVVLSFTNHDFRNMEPDMVKMYNYLSHAVKVFPDVNFQFCEAREAVQLAKKMGVKEPCNITLELKGNYLTITSDAPTFGPQPFFALKTRTGKYYHDNLDFHEPFKKWGYVFDEQTIPLDAIEKLGIGTNDNYGNTTVAVMDVTQDCRVDIVTH